MRSSGKELHWDNWTSMHSDHETSMLVVLAHPDDEFCLFPWIESHAKAGGAIDLVYLTDGGWGGQSIERRQHESLRVLRQLGVDACQVHFLGADVGVPDGGLHLHLDVVEQAFCGLVDAIKPAQVMLPAWEGGHQDHDAAHLMGCLAVQRCDARGWEYCLYHGNRLVGPLFNLLSFIKRDAVVEEIQTGARARIRYAGLCLAYRSQWKSFAGLLPLYVLRLLRSNAFKRRSIDFALTAARPHTGPLLYERRGGPSWREFAAATRRFRQVVPAA